MTLRAVSNPLALSALLTNASAASRCAAVSSWSPRPWRMRNGCTLDHERHTSLWILNETRRCCRKSSVARKSRAARNMGSSDTPVLRTGNSPGRTIPSAVMPRNSSPSDSRARTSMRCRNSEYFGGGSYAGIGRRRRSGGCWRAGAGLSEARNRDSCQPNYLDPDVFRMAPAPTSARPA